MINQGLILLGLIKDIYQMKSISSLMINQGLMLLSLIKDHNEFRYQGLTS